MAQFIPRSNLSQTQKQLPSKFKFCQPQLCCPSGYPITRMCINDLCPIAMICSQIHCLSCGVKVHPACASVPLEGITELLNHKISHFQEFVAQIVQIDQDFIQTMLQSQKTMNDSYILSSLQPQDERVVSEIYRKKNPEALSGRMARQFCERLKWQSRTLKQTTNKIVHNYKQSIATIKEELLYIKKSLIQSINREYTHEDPLSSLISSKILSEDDQQAQQQKQFLNQILSFPDRLELLYRGSQQNFRASTFHQKCDHVPNTLVLVKTQFGKVVGGFSKYPWSSKNQPVNDLGKQSFLFSLSLLQKMAPQHKTSLIWCKPNSGPIFGDGHDLCIADQCNLNRDSFANFPFTYNTEGVNRHVKSQKSIEAFSGATNDINFMVEEYEVFHVFWDEKTEKCSDCRIQ